MISAQNLTMRIGTRVLLDHASFHVDKGMRVGLVGRNGAGKTTLARLLAGESLPDDAMEYTGTISRSGTLGYLPQDTHTGDPGESARDRILSVRGIERTLRQIEKAERDMGTQTGSKQQKAMERFVRLDNEFTMAGGWAANSEASQLAAALGISDTTLKQPMETLSGGQRRRVELARILFSHADTLILDEPTNHLDHDSIVWLRDYLRAYSGSFIVISHSIDLLKDTVNNVWHLDANRGVIDAYHMGWQEYVGQRAADERRRKRENANAQKKADALLAQAEKMRYKATKAVAAQQMIKRAHELLSTVEVTEEDKVAHLRFPAPAPSGKTPLTANGLSKSFGSLEVFTDVSLAIDRASRVVVLGLNGAGKTTLLRILAGLEEPDTGQVVAGHGLKLGYYAQEHETIDGHKTVLQNMVDAAPDLDDTAVRNVLGSFLFSGDDDFKPASVLSGGEKTRLALAMLVVSSANVLLLDEPTNNLDPASRDEILKALSSYEGAVVLVTHDAGAVKALNPDRVLLLPDGDEDLFSDDYLELVELA
ncbi:MAG: ABC-F family ATP-binding cassette domain-containing protein [Actinomycetaceae bacterium]|nr:ABC-F family ATP-binding cassette domain-containing protein [Actinomycetaceae bacterium]MDY6083232.1 ABC-F family ATP-binding cassette domain-containing protein [Actinomycetaceae bacterium]